MIYHDIDVEYHDGFQAVLCYDDIQLEIGDVLEVDAGWVRVHFVDEDEHPRLAFVRPLSWWRRFWLRGSDAPTTH